MQTTDYTLITEQDELKLFSQLQSVLDDSPWLDAVLEREEIESIIAETTVSTKCEAECREELRRAAMCGWRIR